MFYVSSIKDGKIGVTDTSDNIEEFVTNQYLVNLIKIHNVTVYGCYVFNNKAECTVISLDTIFHVDKLRALLNGWKKLHNPWEGYKVRDYLALAPIGTRISAEWQDRDSSGRPFSGVTQLEKLGWDSWKYIDEQNIASGEIHTNARASSDLEVACVYSKCTRLRVL